MSEESTATEKKGKWGAYVCPSCQSIFRLITSSQSQSSRCPTCSDYIHIPPRHENQTANWNQTQQTIAEQTKVEEPEEQTAKINHSPSKQKGAKRRRSSKKSNMEWDSAKENTSSSNSKKPWVTAFLISTLSVAAPLLLLSKYNGIKSLEARIADPANFKQISAEEISSSKPITEISTVDLKKIRSINETIDLCSIAITPFLEASSIDEILPLVHDRERVEPLIRSYYKKFPYKKRGLNKVLGERGARVSGSAYTLNIVTSDYSNDSISCIDQGDETFLVDWESWIGYCELTQYELRKKKPTRPTSVRVVAKKTNYYNFQFSDETQWQAYELSTKASDDILYGYVKKASAVHLTLNNFITENKPSALHLKIRYPKSGQRASQVLIDSVINHGWISE